MKIKNILLLSVLFLTLSNCELLEQEDRTFDGTTLGFQSFTRTLTEPASGAGASIDRTVQVQLIGPQRSTDLPVIIAVDDSSTAVEGVHFQLVTPSPVTIPADSSTANLVYRLLDSPLTAGQSGILYLSIQESEGIVPAKNFRTYSLTINGSN